MKNREKRNTDTSSITKTLELLNIGLSCHAYCLLEHTGICKILKDTGEFSEENLGFYQNPALLRSALVTLVGSKFLSFQNKTFRFTDLGLEIYENLGTIFMPIVGYRDLFAKQFKLASNPKDWNHEDIDTVSIANSSVNFGLGKVDQEIFDILQHVNPIGTICDLGCGNGEKLISICDKFGSSGFGIDICKEAFAKIKDSISSKDRIEFIQSDITKLNGIWEDVDVALMNMVFHDIYPSSKAVEFLKSLRSHFPRLRCLLIVDIVTVSDAVSTILPGFDYVHGLQGIVPRSYDEMIETFRQSGYQVIKETKIKNIPNMFIWALSPVCYS